MADWPHTWVSGDLDTREAPLKWPLDGVGESMSVGEAGAEMKLLSRDLNILANFEKHWDNNINCPLPWARGSGRELRLRTGHLLTLLTAGVHHEAVIQETLRGPGDLTRPKERDYQNCDKHNINTIYVKSPFRGEKFLQIVNPCLELGHSAGLQF